jgi:tetratricopeptide (TPR) repeat protein
VEKSNLDSKPVLVAAHALLGVLVLTAFWPSLQNGFVLYDDPGYVTANPHLVNGVTWQSINWAFASTDQYNWHPVTWLSHLVDYQLFALNPWGHHLTSLLLHAVSTLLLFHVLCLMTAATWRSLLVAALFGLHPLRVESVVWVAERKDVLSSVFFMLTIWAYVKFVKTNSPDLWGRQKDESKARPDTMNETAEQKRADKQLVHTQAQAPPQSSVFFGLALGLYALGLMSKPMLVSLPLVLLLLDWWPLRRWNPKADQNPLSAWIPLIREKWPFFLLAAIFSCIALSVQNRGGAVHNDFPILQRFENAFVFYGQYLTKVFWPADLAVFYPQREHWPALTLLLSIALLAGVSVLVAALRNRLPFLVVGWFWFLGMLMPVIGLVQAGGQAIADRYTYLPSIGLFVGMVWAVSEILAKYRIPPVFRIVPGCLVLLACLPLTYRQTMYWRDSESLFRHAIAVTSDNHQAHNLLAITLISSNRLDAANEELEKSLKIRPNAPDAYGIKGAMLLGRGDLDGGIRCLQQGLALDPTLPDAHKNLGFAFQQQERLEEAIAQFESQLKQKPDDAATRQALAESHNNLGVICCRKGLVNEGINHLRQAVKLEPGYADAQNNLALALAKQNSSSASKP